MKIALQEASKKERESLGTWCNFFCVVNCKETMKHTLRDKIIFLFQFPMFLMYSKHYGKPNNRLPMPTVCGWG